MDPREQCSVACRVAAGRHRVGLLATAFTMEERFSTERLEAAECFSAAREDLQRRVWGLGRIRHVLNERYFPPSWWSGYQAALGEQADISLLPRYEA